MNARTTLASSYPLRVQHVEMSGQSAPKASNTIPTAAERRDVRVNDASTVEKYGKNKISNTKYNALTFLPYNLMEQFKAPINQYFLFIACCQLISVVTPVSPVTT